MGVVPSITAQTQTQTQTQSPSPEAIPAPAILVQNISKTFRRGDAATGVRALEDVSFQIKPNSFVSVVGPSGCGKTTLLRLLNGLIQPDSGSILLDGATPIPGSHIGFVFQSFCLMPWRTIRANVSFALEVHGVGAQERASRADEYLNLVGLSQFAESYPAELSGGMKQRAALARALVGRPRFLFMDLPHPRWSYDVRARPEFAELRGHLWGRIKEMVAMDPESEFFLRDETWWSNGAGPARL